MKKYNYPAISFLFLYLLIATGCKEKIEPSEPPIANGITGELRWALSSDGTLTISGNGEMPDYPFARQPWFDYSSTITAVVINNGVTSIGTGAFYGCTGLTSVAIPNSVTNIGNNAFSGCTGLTSIVIPNSVTSIGSNAFSGCIGLTSVAIPNSVTSIETRAFYGCTGLTSVNIPNSVTSVNLSAFRLCENLISINVDNNNGVYSSADGVLFNKTKTILLQYPFGKAGAYTIPNSVTSIEKYAFDACTGLTIVTIPNSVNSVELPVFIGCSNLISIYVDNDHATYRSEDGVLFDKTKTSLIKYPIGRIGAYTVPNSVADIGNAFYFCHGLTSVTFPSSVTTISQFAFSGCGSLIAINVDSDHTAYSSEDGVLFNKTKTTLIKYPLGRKGAYTIPNSVISIGSSSFTSYNDNLTSVNIPNSVTHIESNAFSFCHGLTSVAIPNSVIKIENNAFAHSSGITSVIIGSSVKEFGTEVFTGCPITDITIMSATPPQRLDWFFGSGHLYSCTIRVPAVSVEAYRADTWWGQFINIVPIEETTKTAMNFLQKRTNLNNYNSITYKTINT